MKPELNEEIWNQVRAMVRLLDDRDPEVVEAVESKLTSMGTKVIPFLEASWDGAPDEILQTKIEELIHHIQFEDIRKELTGWIENGYTDLLFGTYLIARYQYPEVRFEEIDQKLEEIRHDVWLELAPNLTALEKVKIINHILFDEHRFAGNMTNYYSPRNSYINQVLEQKKGNPILLSVIYSVIAQRLGLPVYGVNLPKNFILAYADEHPELMTPEGDEYDRILFYINPFNRGAVFGRKEIDHYITQQKLEPRKSFYVPCSNLEIIRRILLNLIYSYEQQGLQDKVQQLQSLFALTSQ
jgi:regulator of sirC expression with transglutaminase-like and TPR domain